MKALAKHACGIVIADGGVAALVAFCAWAVYAWGRVGELALVAPAFFAFIVWWAGAIHYAIRTGRRVRGGDWP